MRDPARPPLEEHVKTLAENHQAKLPSCSGAVHYNSASGAQPRLYQHIMALMASSLSKKNWIIIFLFSVNDIRVSVQFA